MRTAGLLIALVCCGALAGSSITSLATSMKHSNLNLSMRSPKLLTSNAEIDGDSIIIQRNTDRIDQLLTDNKANQDNIKLVNDKIYQMSIEMQDLSTKMNILGLFTGLIFTSIVGPIIYTKFKSRAS